MLMVFWLSELQGNVSQKVGDRGHMQCSLILSPLPHPCPSPLLVSPYHQNPGPPTWQPNKISCPCPKPQLCSRLVSFHSIQRLNVNAQMNPWKPHSSHIQKPAHTQSKAADSSPFPQISMPESTESACAPFPAWGWEGTVRFKAWWRIYLFLHIWCWGIMVKGRIPLSHCAGHRQHYCWKSVLTHTPLQTHTVFGNQESPTACSLTKSRSLRGSSKSSILSIVLKVESRVSPCCGAGNVCDPTEC